MPESDMASEQSSSDIEYKYTPLQQGDSIRLLDLQPSTSVASILEGSLREFTLSSCPEFIALSYSWATEDGDSSLSKSMRCDGALVKITANLEAALRRLRLRDEVRVLWADAVCIDQSKDEEKSVQVSLMRQIYNQANVALWLGEISSDVDEETLTPLSDLGMDYLHELAVEIADRKNSDKAVHEGALYQEFVKDRRAFRKRGIEAFTPRVRGLWDILHRSWWGRLWVVQEVALAKTASLICGGRSEAFHNLTIVIEGLIAKDLPADEFEHTATFLTSAFHQFNSRYLRERAFEDATPGGKALRILNATRNTRATDPRDKIYGILGFFGNPESDPHNIFPQPDYSRTAAEVYADVSRAIIAKSRSLDVMTSCYGFIRSSIPDLPSWVAAWNDTPLKYFDEGHFNASSGSSVIYEDSGDGRILKIKGKRVDSVKDIADISGSMEYTNEIYTKLWRQWSELALSLTCYPTGKSLVDVLMDTLLWGSNSMHDRRPIGEYRESFEAWLKILQSEDSLDVVATNIFEDLTASTYTNTASLMALGRTLGTTEKGYICLTPLTVLAGDTVVIFSGGKVPFLVRDEGDGISKLVGPVYLDGIMEGEAFLKGSSTSDELEWFLLR